MGLMPRIISTLKGWRLDFLTLHYLFIIGSSLTAFLILACFGNLSAINAFFFAVSSTTESGLNPVDVKDLYLAQQLVIFFFPILTNLATVNIFTVVIRIWYFEKRFREIGPSVLKAIKVPPRQDVESHSNPVRRPDEADVDVPSILETPSSLPEKNEKNSTIQFSSTSTPENASSSEGLRARHSEKAGKPKGVAGLTHKDRLELGGVEYRSLKLLLKILIGIYAALHIFGYVGLTPWILHSPAKYREYLASQGVNPVFWAFYSAETMVSNCGFTLTADSMISFRDAAWPMVLMTFLAFAGNTCHPIILRFTIWSMHKLAPKTSSLQESLRFLLDHSRRCYTLLFPSNTTWILFGILFVLNFVDVLLIVVLDLNNPEVSALSLPTRLNAATFQAASARHTGTASFNLAKVNPAVQFSLLTMMYISVFPIAMSMRSTNAYEDTWLGKFSETSEPQDSQPAKTYLVTHIRNQLSFDLWYVFLGTFCICIAESGPIMDPNNAAFNVFAVMFECVSAYGNVGLSLGTNSTLTSLSGDFTIFSKVVICFMMWRGRHRGLPYALDHAVMLPTDLVDAREHQQGHDSLNERFERELKLSRWKTM